MLPLDDVRVVAVEQYGAGPWATLQLAELGAEVIKIEDPGSGGDVGRHVPPFRGDDDSLFFQAFNRNKRSIALDLRTEAGLRVFHELVARSDAVFSNLRGDVPRALGLTYEDLKSVNEAIVCCSLSAYGMTGPRASQPGYDYVLQGLAGWMSLTGEPDGPPTKTGLSLVDYSGGYVAALSLLAGVHQARRSGLGMDCDVSLFDTALSLLTYVGTWNLTRDLEPRRTRHSAHPSLFPFQAFQTEDGWIMVACAKEKFWVRLVEAMELDEIGNDERFGDFAGRMDHADELTLALDRRFMERSTAEWISCLQGHGVPCGPVNDVRAAFDDPQAAARGIVVEFSHPEFGTVRAPRTAVDVGSARVHARRAPRLDEDRDDVLGGLLGMSEGMRQQLASDGAFGGDERR